MDYRTVIASKARSNETVRSFAYRTARSNNFVTASVLAGWWPSSKDNKQPQPNKPQAPVGKNFIIFNFDKKSDTMHVSQNGSEIISFRGEDAWGKAIDYFKRKFVRKELDPKTTHFLYQGNKGMIDISSDFAMAGRA
jgi:hypothetical protein